MQCSPTIYNFEPERSVWRVCDSLVDLREVEVSAAAVVVGPRGAAVADGARALDPVAGRRVDVVRVAVAKLVCNESQLEDSEEME